MTMNADSWMLEDRNGKLWKYDVAAESSVCISEYHSGPVNAVATSYVDHFSATAGEDGTIRCWDYVDKSVFTAKNFPILLQR